MRSHIGSTRSDGSQLPPGTRSAGLNTRQVQPVSLHCFRKLTGMVQSGSTTRQACAGPASAAANVISILQANGLPVPRLLLEGVVSSAADNIREHGPCVPLDAFNSAHWQRSFYGALAHLKQTGCIRTSVAGYSLTAHGHRRLAGDLAADIKISDAERVKSLAVGVCWSLGMDVPGHIIAASYIPHTQVPSMCDGCRYDLLAGWIPLIECDGRALCEECHDTSGYAQPFEEGSAVRCD